VIFIFYAVQYHYVHSEGSFTIYVAIFSPVRSLFTDNNEIATFCIDQLVWNSVISWLPCIQTFKCTGFQIRIRCMYGQEVCSRKGPRSWSWV